MTRSFLKGEPEAVNRQCDGSRRDLIGVQMKTLAGAPSHWHVRVVSKIAPNSGEVLHDGYIQLPQLFRGADARQGEDVRRPYGSGTEDDLIAVDGVLILTADTRSPIALCPSKMIPCTRELGLMVSPGRSRAGSR